MHLIHDVVEALGPDLSLEVRTELLAISDRLLREEREAGEYLTLTEAGREALREVGLI